MPEEPAEPAEIAPTAGDAGPSDVVVDAGEAGPSEPASAPAPAPAPAATLTDAEIAKKQREAAREAKRAEVAAKRAAEVYTGNAAKFDDSAFKNETGINSDRELLRQLKEEDRREAKNNPDLKDRPGKKIERPMPGDGRAPGATPTKSRAGAVTATPGAAVKSPASRILKWGDAELKLDVAGLSAFEAMKATMKELGFDEDEQYEDDDYEGEAEEGEEGASPEPARKILKWGDAELKLDVEGLSAYEAMKATMKELGYDEDAEGEEGEEGEVGYEDPSDEEAGGGGSTPTATGSASASASASATPSPFLHAAAPAPASVRRPLSPSDQLSTGGREYKEEEANKNKRTQNLVMAAAIVCVIGGVATGIAIFMVQDR